MTDSFLTTPDVQRQEIRRLVEYAAERHRGDPYAGKRTSKRFRTPIHLDVMLDPKDPVKTAPVTLHNISATGLGFIGRTELESGIEVYIRESAADPPGPWIECRITHSTQGIRGFVVGAEFCHPIEEIKGANAPSITKNVPSVFHSSESRGKQDSGEKRGILSWLGFGRD